LFEAKTLRMFGNSCSLCKTQTAAWHFDDCFDVLNLVFPYFTWNVHVVTSCVERLWGKSRLCDCCISALVERAVCVTAVYQLRWKEPSVWLLCISFGGKSRLCDCCVSALVERAVCVTALYQLWWKEPSVWLLCISFGG
jgi:hypothetical protein